MTLFAVLQRLYARLGERNIGIRPKPHIPTFAVELEPEHPGLGASGGNPEVEPAAIVQHRRAFGVLYIQCREFAGTRLFPLLSYPGTQWEGGRLSPLYSPIVGEIG